MSATEYSAYKRMAASHPLPAGRLAYLIEQHFASKKVAGVRP